MIEQRGNINMENTGNIWSDIGVRELFAKMLARKWLMVLIPIIWLLFTNIGFYFSGTAYSGELLVVPASLSGESTRGAVGGALSSFGLDIAGVGGAGTDQNFSIYLESWTSSWLAEQILANKPLTHKLFAGMWSESEKQWIRPSGLGSVIKPAVKKMLGGTPSVWGPPATEDVVSFLASHITEVKTRGQVTTKIAIELRDPVLAEELLKFGHASINAHLAELFRTRADQNVSYILSQLNKVSIAEYREALLNTLAQVERTRMLAFSNPEFAATSLSLYVTSNPVKPQASKIIGIAAFATIFFYLLLVFLADLFSLPTDIRLFLRCRKVTKPI